jgi:hypothetical protein
VRLIVGHECSICHIVIDVRSTIDTAFPRDLVVGTSLLAQQHYREKHPSIHSKPSNSLKFFYRVGYGPRIEIGKEDTLEEPQHRGRDRRTVQPPVA